MPCFKQHEDLGENHNRQPGRRFGSETSKDETQSLIFRNATSTRDSGASLRPYLALSPSLARGVDRIEESGVTFCGFGICSEETSLV
jgi:hypothetical protein